MDHGHPGFAALMRGFGAAPQWLAGDRRGQRMHRNAKRAAERVD